MAPERGAAQRSRKAKRNLDLSKEVVPEKDPGDSEPFDMPGATLHESEDSMNSMERNRGRNHVENDDIEEKYERAISLLRGKVEETRCLQEELSKWKDRAKRNEKRVEELETALSQAWQHARGAINKYRRAAEIAEEESRKSDGEELARLRVELQQEQSRRQEVELQLQTLRPCKEQPLQTSDVACQAAGDDAMKLASNLARSNAKLSHQLRRTQRRLR